MPTSIKSTKLSVGIPYIGYWLICVPLRVKINPVLFWCSLRMNFFHRSYFM